MTSIQAFTLLFLLFTVLWVAVSLLRRRRTAFMRSIAAFSALPSQIGRAAESGQTLHFSLGTGGIGGQSTVASMAGLSALAYLVEQGVATETPPLITVSDPTLLPLAQETLRAAYSRHGLLKEFQPSQVRLVAPTPIGYAAGTMDLLNRESVSANILLGAFGPEAGLITQAGSNSGLTQVAGTDDLNALSVFFASTDRVAIGEELYAADVYLSRRPSWVSTLIAEDDIRLFLVLGIIVAGVLKLFQVF